MRDQKSPNITMQRISQPAVPKAALTTRAENETSKPLKKANTHRMRGLEKETAIAEIRNGNTVTIRDETIDTGQSSALRIKVKSRLWEFRNKSEPVSKPEIQRAQKSEIVNRLCVVGNPR